MSSIEWLSGSKSGSNGARVILCTQGEVLGKRRKLAWFHHNKHHFYFEAGGLLWGSHTSYHQDGNIFRTSPATGNRPQFQEREVALKDFHGWHQFGTTLIGKAAISSNPPVRPQDGRKGNLLVVVDLARYPMDTLNVVVELLLAENRAWLNEPNIQPHPDADVKVIELERLLLVLTVLGHEKSLLVRPHEDGFFVSHYNSRYSANAPGVRYSWEAYSAN